MAATNMSNFDVRNTNLGLRIVSRGSAFATAWLAHPRRVGAIAPSSRRLARLITSEICPAAAPVLELGAGTGVFTRALLARGLRQEQLILLECDPHLARLLRREYPQAWVAHVDVTRLCCANIVDGEPIGAVVSGLPLLSMSMRQRIAVLRFAFRHLRSGAAYYQFTYGLRCPVPRPVLEAMGLKATRLGSTMLNAPPATVFRIRQRWSATR